MRAWYDPVRREGGSLTGCFELVLESKEYPEIDDGFEIPLLDWAPILSGDGPA